MRNRFISVIGLSIIMSLLLTIPTSAYELNRWGYIPSKEEVKTVCQVVALEAGNQSDEGKQAIVELILNRVYSDKFPNTVEEVLYQKGQFTVVNYLHKAKVTDNIQENVYSVFNGTTLVLPYNMYFYQTGKTGQTGEINIQDHYFRENYK